MSSNHRVRILSVALMLCSPMLVSACAQSADSLCDSSFSVSSISTLLAHGLENVSESQYADLQHDVETADKLTKAAIRSDSENVDAVHFAVKLQQFIRLMDGFSWDFSKALLDTSASQAAADLGSAESLQQANTVESFLITTCGMPSTVAIDIAADTLPSPSIPSPTATDPTSDAINQASEHIATGKILANIYGVVISDSEAQCLGAALDGVVDATSANANSDQYSQQFQKAFDLCGVSISTSTTTK